MYHSLNMEDIKIRPIPASTNYKCLDCGNIEPVKVPQCRKCGSRHLDRTEFRVVNPSEKE